MSPTIAILGAGPAGLLLGRLLDLAGIDFIIFERDTGPSAITTGGSLDIHAEDGQVALREAGLLEEFKSLARYDAQTVRAIDGKNGSLLWDKKHNKDDEGRPEMDRPQLRQLLLDSVPAERIRWDSRVYKIERDTNGLMTVYFSTGAPPEDGFKLIIGADGAWSKARKLVTSAVPVYSGYTQLQLTISPSNAYYHEAEKVIGKGMFIALNGGSSIIAQQMSTDVYNIYVGMAVPEDQLIFAHNSRAADAGTGGGFMDLLRSGPCWREYLLKTYFPNWSAEATGLIRHSDTDVHTEQNFRAWPLYAMPKGSLCWETVPGVTLVGDAAHLSVPNGEGVNHALLDALKLTEQIKRWGADGLDVAVEVYERDMFERGKTSIEEGEEFKGMFWADDAPRGFVEWVKSMPKE